MCAIRPAILLAALALLASGPAFGQGTIPSWGAIAQPAEVRALRETIARQAMDAAVSATVLDRLARHVGGRYRSMGYRELERRVVGIARRLSDAERSEAELRQSFSRIPPSAREEIDRGWALLREGLLDDALRHLRRAETITRSTSGVASADYARLVSLTANIFEMQQDPRGAADQIRTALDERRRSFRDSQDELAEQVFQTELRWAREEVSAEAAGRALQVQREYGLYDGAPGGRRGLAQATRRRVFVRDLRRCEIADLYFIRAAGTNAADLRAGLERLQPTSAETDGDVARDWECRSVLARLEVGLGILRSDKALVFQGMSRLDSILRYWGATGTCPMAFQEYGPAIYRLGISIRTFAARDGSGEVAARLASYQDNLRYGHSSLLPSPAPVNLHAYLSEIGIYPATQ